MSAQARHAVDGYRALKVRSAIGELRLAFVPWRLALSALTRFLLPITMAIGRDINFLSF
jgi:hypothetical protein